MRVIILCGLPRVGKLTIAKEFAQAHGYRVLHNHLVFDAVESLFTFGLPAFAELRERLWVELLCRAVRERVGDIIFTIARDRCADSDFLVRASVSFVRWASNSCRRREAVDRVADSPQI